MKVLILHQFYNTPEEGGALRSYYLASALAAKGFNPVVLTTHNFADIKVTAGGGVEVHYLPVTYNNRYGFFRRVYSFLLFVWRTVKYAGKFREASVCYAISTPLTTGIAAMWIKLRYKIPYYFEVGDLWPEAPIQMGFVKNPFLKFILYSLERKIYNSAEKIVALSPSIKKSIEEKVNAKPVSIIPNMADTEVFFPEEKQRALEEKYGVMGKFVISYTGTFGLANGLEYIIECASLAKQVLPEIHFLLCGDGMVRSKLINMVKDRLLTNVTLIPFQNRDGVKEILNVTDAVFVCYKPLKVLETGSPNKFFDGLAAGKLMILNFGGWMEEETINHNCGVRVDPFNPQ
ncbi:MAG: glycosyltransferase family 4 protein, partial [Cyclobacteriaceae bacterium]|nr:glycosyltransferase family 4 protein [Cyclobacteriaceae bacterium]